MTNCGEFVRDPAASWLGGSPAVAQDVWVLQKAYFRVLIFQNRE